MSAAPLQLHDCHVEHGPEPKPEFFTAKEFLVTQEGTPCPMWLKAQAKRMLNSRCRANIDAPPSFPVHLDKTGLIIETGESEVSVPLLQALVVHSSAEPPLQCSVLAVALGTWEEGNRAKGRQKAPCRCESLAVWFLSLDGDEDELNEYLFNMCSRGAMRSDLFNAFEFSRKAMASGHSGSVHEVRPLAADLRGDFAQSLLYPVAMAAKVAPMHSRAEDQDVSNDEVALLFRAQGHPNIVRIHGVFWCGSDERKREAGKGMFATEKQVLLMELCPHGDLHRNIRVNGAMAEFRAREMITQILSGLAHLHALGIVHRDIKAQNILVASDGQPLIADFGIAGCMQQGSLKLPCGTPGYAAPEIWKNQPYTAKVDVFSAGVVLFFMMVGSLPFGGEDLEEVSEKTSKCRVFFPDGCEVSAQMKTYIRLLLMKEAEHRPTARCAKMSLALVPEPELELGLSGDQETDAPLEMCENQGQSMFGLIPGTPEAEPSKAAHHKPTQASVTGGMRPSKASAEGYHRTSPLREQQVTPVEFDAADMMESEGTTTNRRGRSSPAARLSSAVMGSIRRAGAIMPDVGARRIFHRFRDRSSTKG